MSDEEFRKEYDQYKNSITENKSRYEDCITGSYEKLIKKANKLKVVIDDGLF